MTTKSDKPHKGQITNVKKWELSEKQRARYDELCGPNLGYMYTCDFLNHPTFQGRSGHTSLVVKDDPETGEVETLNSRYTIVQ